MSFLKKLFGKTDSKPDRVDIPITVINRDTISMNSVNVKPSGEIVVDFDVPSKKDFSITIEKDDFTHEKTFRFKTIASSISDKIMTWADGIDIIQFNFGLKNSNGYNLLTFETYQENIKLNKGDKIIFLFSDHEKREFELSEKDIKWIKIAME